MANVGIESTLLTTKIPQMPLRFPYRPEPHRRRLAPTLIARWNINLQGRARDDGTKRNRNK